MTPTDKRFREIFNTLEPYIEERFGIPVVIKDVPDPFKGDLDGAEIQVELEAFERQACAYSLQLFHDVGVRDLDQ